MTDGFRLDGRTALVTGASRGLGKAMAEALGEAGARVVLVSRTIEDLDRAADEFAAASYDVVTKAFDLSEVAGIAAWVADIWSEVGPVEIVVHSAGHQRRAGAVEVELDDWDRILTVNLTAPFFLSREVGKRQIEAGSIGSHIFVGSLTTNIGIARAAPYAASKAGIAGVVRTLAVEWAADRDSGERGEPGIFSHPADRGRLSGPGAKRLDSLPHPHGEGGLAR